MSDRVVVFIDYQNVYRSARSAFHKHEADPRWYGQVNPHLLGGHLVADSPFDRELTEVRIYRGLPSNARDPKGYGATRKQINAWKGHPQVTVKYRSLQYPSGWPHSHEPGQRPHEKASMLRWQIDFAVMAVRKQFDAGIWFSLDTDLTPSLEFVSDLQRAWGRPRAEVAASTAEGVENARLSVKNRKIFCHWLAEASYEAVRATPTTLTDAMETALTINDMPLSPISPDCD